MDVTKTDDQLVQDVLLGDQDAFAPLIQRYQQQMYRFALSLSRSPADAEDIVSESFIKIYTSLHRFQLGTSFKSWIMTITYRTGLDLLRLHKRQPTSPLDLAPEPPSSRPQPLEQLMAAETSEILMAALEKLSPQDRAGVFMYYYQEASYAEISEILGWPMGTVASKLNRSRKKLRKILEEGEINAQFLTS